MQYMSIKPIGHVKNNIKEPVREGWEMVVSELVLNNDLEEAIEGLEQFSHIIVVFWMHKDPSEKRVPTKVHPRGRYDLPLVGLFSTRSPHRPNSIGISAVRLLERKGNVLKVEGLDAIDGTPIIDIKPYLPGDCVPDTAFPQWVAKL
ncbi:tRNA (N6-threonylcarbamoyladenosine(37)-N6)-methyltransferase TrmO [Chloroflexota bacterium]